MNKKVIEKTSKTKKNQTEYDCCLEMKQQIDIYNTLFEKLSRKISNNISEIVDLKSRVKILESNPGLFYRIRKLIGKK